MKGIGPIVAFLTIVFLFFSLSIPKAKSDNPGSTLIQLTTNPYMDVWPSWHPSGSKIVYCAFSNDWDRSIWVLDFFNPLNKVALTNGYIDECPSFSSDGKKITFARWGLRGDYTDLMIMNSDGSNITRITFGGIPGLEEGCYESNTFSKDGQEILFEYWPGPSPGAPDHYVGTMNSDGSDVRILGYGTHPHWSPDNSKIVYYYPFDGAETSSIYIMNRDGTNIVKLTDGALDREPDMSPTGKIVFSRNVDLFIMDDDGSNMQKLLDDGRQPHWSPDGKWIVFWSQQRSGNRDIWALMYAAPVPVGGYAVPIEGPTIAKPLAPYFALIATLTVGFMAIKRKTLRRTE